MSVPAIAVLLLALALPPRDAPAPRPQPQYRSGQQVWLWAPVGANGLGGEWIRGTYRAGRRDFRVGGGWMPEHWPNDWVHRGADKPTAPPETKQ